jgi:predicted DNA-binding antitoxin AbrB/MazE fold protein
MECEEDRADQRETKMPKIVEAVFENGVLKPLEALELEEHQRVRLLITPVPGVVVQTRGVIAAPPHVVEEVAESDEFLPS